MALFHCFLFGPVVCCWPFPNSVCLPLASARLAQEQVLYSVRWVQASAKSAPAKKVGGRREFAKDRADARRSGSPAIRGGHAMNPGAMPPGWALLS